MKRRDFLAGMGMLACAAGTRSVWAAADASAPDVIAAKQAVENVYSTFSVSMDKDKYRSLLTEDYLLLENGELLDIEGDLALMSAREDGYQRTDEFDFSTVKVHGDIAYLVYFLKSDITDKKRGTRHRRYLESAILRRSDTGWRLALLHSTKIPEPRG
jgi:ketosteroid isomerase-like protein